MKQDVYKLIENVPINVELTKQQLVKKYGFSDHYLRVAKERFLLENISRGNYIKRAKGHYFNEFKRCVRNNDYEGAYEYLKKMILSRVNHDFDNHYRIYLILVEKILDVKDSKVDSDSILEFTEVLHSEGTYYKYFVEFRENVMAGNWQKAFECMNKFGSVERERTGHFNASTSMFYKLISKVVENESLVVQEAKEELVNEFDFDVVEKNLNSEVEAGEPFLSTDIKESSAQKTEQEIARDKFIVHKKLYETFYSKFKNSYEGENYDCALDNLYECLKYVDYKNRNKVQLLVQLIETYIKLIKNERILENKFIDYQYANGNYKRIFWDAMINEDYIVALQNVGKYCYDNPNSEFLKIYKDVLHKMRKFWSKDEKIKSQPIGIEKIEEKQEEKIVLSYELVNKLVEGRCYEELFSILERYGVEKLNFEYKYIYFIVKDVLELFTGKTINKRVIPSDKLQQYSPQLFFVALNYKDYEQAYQYLGECMPGQIKFQDIYINILVDILDLQRINSNYNELVNLIRLINKFGYIDKDKLNSLLDLRINLGKTRGSIINLDTSYDFYAKELVELFELTLEKKIDFSLFGKFEYDDFNGRVEVISKINEEGEVIEKQVLATYDKDDLISKFLIALEFADYCGALEFTLNKSWDEQIKNHPKRQYLELYKNILNKVNSICIKNRQEKMLVLSKSSSLDDKMDGVDLFGDNTDYLAKLIDFRKIIKNKGRNKPIDYVKALQYYRDNLNGKMLLDAKDETVLHLMLEYLSRKQENNAWAVYHMYKEALHSRCVKEAREYLDKYQDLIEDSSLNRCLDYHYEGIDALEEDLKREDFEELFLSYQWGVYFFKGNRFQDCIKAFDKYINLNPKLAFQAYLLQGRAYERLNNYEKAEENYRKILENSHLPEAYIRLGNIYFSRKEYDKAKEYYLEFHKRKPFHLVRALEPLEKVYKKLGDKEKVQYYRKRIIEAKTRKNNATSK